MKLRIWILTGFIFSSLLPVKAQQDNIWYFGSRAGINFTPNGPHPVPYPDLNSAMVATEGSASICDNNGKILFYSNGHTVYNRNHDIMQNGDGLAGHQSAFQTVLIVPQPNKPNLYYIFTSDAYENGFANGNRYSIVDMNLDNGNGAVTTKNILLHAPCTERMAAARHANGVDVWIITNDNNSNIFRAWLLTCTGLQSIPVVSITGLVMDQNPFSNTGSMKVSPNGKKLCQTEFPDADGLVTETPFQIFDFDNTSGVLSNPKTITIATCLYYSCEFSPDSKLLYLTRADGGIIDQFECTLNTETDVIASQYSIQTGVGLCGIQLGPDGKIYLCYFYPSLSVISKPNVKGPGCLFELNKINLGGPIASLNLPSFINDLSVNPLNDFTATVIDTCAGIVRFDAHANLSGTISWTWDFGDGTSSNQQNPVHDFPSIYQLYQVKLKISSTTACGTIERMQMIAPGGYLRQLSFQIKNLCDSGFARFTNASTFYPENPGHYLWEFGDGQSSTTADTVHSYQQAGTYTVKLKLITTAGCLDDSLSRSLDFQMLHITAIPDQVINEGQSVQLNVSGGGSTFTWSPPLWLNNPNIQNPIATPPDDILYVVTVMTNTGCRDIDSVRIKVKLQSDIFVPSAFTPNNDGRNDIFKPVMSKQFKLARFSIYNRWGQIVFTTSDIGKGWDGKINGVLQENDTYVWIIQAIDKDKKIVEKNGTVTLIH